MVDDRAYPFGSDRQQDADRLVATEDELRAVLRLARTDGSPVSTVRLKCNIATTRPIPLVNASYGIVVDGGGKYGIFAGKSFVGSSLFTASAGFSDLLFRDITLAAPTGVKHERLIAFPNGGILSNVSLERAVLFRIKRVVQADTGTLTVRASEYDDVLFAGGLNLGDVTNIGTAAYSRCGFNRCYALVGTATNRLVNIDDTAGSSQNVAIEAGPLSTSTSISLVSGLSASQLYALTTTGDITAGGVVTGAQLCIPATSQTIGGASPVLSPAGTSSIAFTIAVGATGTWSIAAGVEGQVLFLRCINNNPPLALADLGIVRIAGPWTPATSDTMLLHFSGGVWCEYSRSDN